MAALQRIRICRWPKWPLATNAALPVTIMTIMTMFSSRRFFVIIVIYVICVITGQTDQPALPCAVGVEADASWLQELIIKAAETADHALRLDLRLSHSFHQLCRRTLPLFPALHEICQSIEKRRVQVRRRCGFFRIVLRLRQLPNAVVERKRNRLVLHVPSRDPERAALRDTPVSAAERYPDRP